MICTMGMRVLVIDDEPDIRDLLVMLLRDDPRCDLVTATGELDSAVELTVETAPDVVVVDVMFGHRTCADVLPELRTAAPAAHIIVFTSSRRAAMGLGLLDLGADVIVQKVTVSFDEVANLALTPPLHLPDAEPVAPGPGSST